VRALALGAAILTATGVARADPVGESAVSSSEAVGAAPAGKSVTIAAVGDILFGRYLRTGRYRRVAATDDPFAEVAPVLTAADIALANVECPIMAEPKEVTVNSRSLTFRCEPEDAAVLAAAGFDVVSAANNHMLNLGTRGAAQTARNLVAAGIAAVGAGEDEEAAFEPVVVEVGGARVAVLGFTTWTNGRRPADRNGAVAFVSTRRMRTALAERVRAARERLDPDFLIVTIHWGWEKEDGPRDEQVRAAHAMIDAGADVVLGHHPHVVHEIERYGNGLIAYSLGNFLFDNPAESWRRSVILEVTLEAEGDDRRVADVTLHPVVLERDFRASSSVPKLATGKVYRRWKRALRALAGGATIAPDPGR